MSAGKSKEISSGFTASNKAKLVRGGQDYFRQLLLLIEQARETIHLQTYIYASDETGKTIGNALIAAAKRNVQVYLIADGYASREMSPAFIRQLEEAGVHFRFFEPLFKSGYYYFGRRLHHKLFVADNQYALVGGVNISNNYNDLPGKPAWLDFALFAEGEIARELCVLCWKTWNGYPKRNATPPCGKMQADTGISPEEACFIRMRRNDWVRGKNQVSKSYIQVFRQATAEIIIVSSYFLPGRHFRKKISEAARRGVRVRVLLAGTSDVSIAKQAERYMYRWLLKDNIEIYEYLPTVLHGKIAICDDKWFTIGSYNVNNISAFASIELNLDVSNEKLAGSVKQTIESIIEKDCIRITEKKLNTGHHLLRRLWQEICYTAIRVLYYLFTFYFKRKR